MNPRQFLDRTVLRITGKDIRLVGNWSRLWCLRDYGRDIAEALHVSESDLLECDDITEILELTRWKPTEEIPFQLFLL